MDDTKRRLLFHGILLVFLALLTGGIVPLCTTPRLGLAAHVGGIMNGTLIAVIGAFWDQLTLAERGRLELFWTAVYSGYANWLGLLLAGIWGTSQSTPLLGEGHVGAPWQEAVVFFFLTTGAVVILIACVLVLRGLRARA